MRSRRELPPEGDGDAKRLKRQREDTLQEIEAERQKEASTTRRRGQVGLRRPDLRVDQQLDPVRFPSVFGPRSAQADRAAEQERVDALRAERLAARNCGCPPDHPHQNDAGVEGLPRCCVPGCPHFLETRWDGPQEANDAPCVFRFGDQARRASALMLAVSGTLPGTCGVPRAEHTRSNGLFHPYEAPPTSRTQLDVSLSTPTTPDWWRAGLDASDIGREWDIERDDPDIDDDLDNDVDDVGATIASVADRLRQQLLPSGRFVNPSLTTEGVLLRWDFGSNTPYLSDERIHIALRSIGEPQFALCGVGWRTLDERAVIKGELCSDCLDAGTRAGRIRPA